MASRRTSRLLLSCLIVGIVARAIEAKAQTTEVTAQAKVKLTGAAGARANHSNEGVVLWLTPADPTTLPEQRRNPPRGHLQLAQTNKQFVPHILVAQVGSVIDFPNLDPFFHNVFSLFNGKRFDLGLYESGSSRSVHFDRAGVSYIFCNIHPEMSAVVVTVPTPYFASSSAAGALVIHDVVPGTYIVHAWAMGNSDTTLAAVGRRVSISGSTTDLGVITLQESADSSHKNKFGEDYEEKRPSTY
jgi:plastocyanin